MTTMNHAQLPLSTYLQAVKMAIDDIFATPVWVVAEIRAMNSKLGHYYFELAEKNSDGAVNASCKATLWRSVAQKILYKFQQKTQLTLSVGMKVLLHGKASFHPQYGFSFTIDDIDPSYTLGELAQAYDEMRKKLDDNGLLTLNKRLPTPFDIKHILVIAPENAAGLGDFRADADILAHANACQFDYRHATFQGNHAPTSIRHAIADGLADFVATYSQLPDLLVIIRGGGAVGDLAYLNDYELAAMVAELPMPVWVGIGHEKDKVILDEVAHTRFDTPSKVIIAIKTHLAELWLTAKRYYTAINQHSQYRLSQQQQALHHALSTLKDKSVNWCKQCRLEQNHQLSTIKRHAKNHLQTYRQNSLYHLQRHKIAHHHLQSYQHHINHWRALILTHHPTQVLNKGYVLVQDTQGKAITRHTQLHAKMTVWLSFKDGQVSATINQPTPKPKPQATR